MREIVRTSQFKRDFKRVKKSGLDLTKLTEVIRLRPTIALPANLRDHATNRGRFGSKLLAPKMMRLAILSISFVFRLETSHFKSTCCCSRKVQISQGNGNDCRQCRLHRNRAESG